MIKAIVNYIVSSIYKFNNDLLYIVRCRLCSVLKNIKKLEGEIKNL